MRDAGELIETFRSDVVDVAQPYLWTPDEVLGYAQAAYNMFVRLTGGIADFLSEACSVELTAGEAESTLHPSIMRVTSATRRSDKHPVKVINYTDIGKMRSSDYGQIKQLVMDEKMGPVMYMVHGMKRGTVRWVQVPMEADTIDLTVYRLPLNRLTDEDCELFEVDEDHHIYLLDWMKHLAYKKQDADTYDVNKSERCKADFENYCALVKKEWERYKHKTREVSYGGL